MSFGINGTVFLPPKPLKQGKLVEKTCEFVKVGLYRAHVIVIEQIAQHLGSIGAIHQTQPELNPG